MCFRHLALFKNKPDEGARWQHVRVGPVFLIASLWKVFSNRALGMPLFSHVGTPPQRARRLAGLFKAVLEVLEVPSSDKHGCALSGLRAGGITAFFQQTQDLSLPRWRGRRDIIRTLEHYIQELPMAEHFARLPSRVRVKLARLSSLLPALAQEAELSVPPPLLPRGARR